VASGQEKTGRRTAGSLPTHRRNLHQGMAIISNRLLGHCSLTGGTFTKVCQLSLTDCWVIAHSQDEPALRYGNYLLHTAGSLPTHRRNLHQGMAIISNTLLGHCPLTGGYFTKVWQLSLTHCWVIAHSHEEPAPRYGNCL
jgi:hypothetical protein